MLLAQQGRRAQHRHLPPAGDRAEGGTQGDFRFTETDVAADQAVHWSAGFHVLNDGHDGGGLIGRFLKAKAIGEGVVIVRREFESVTFACCAAGVQGQKFGCCITRLQGGFFLGLFPLRRTQCVQRRGFRVGAGVTRNNPQLGNRHVELGLVRVMQLKELRVAFTEVHVHQTLIAADAVLLVYHRVADLEFGQIAQPVVE